MKNFKKLFLSILLSLVFAATIFAIGHTRDFPYEYYTSSEISYRDFSKYYSGKQLENDNDWIVIMYQDDRTNYIVHQYKQGKEPGLSELYKILKDHKSVYKTLDSKIDKVKGYDCNVCLIFLDCYNRLILWATYSENY